MFWLEFDFGNCIWYLFEDRIKKRRVIDILLVEFVVEWLNELKVCFCGSDWVFLVCRISKKVWILYVCENMLNYVFKKFFEKKFFLFDKCRVYDLWGMVRIKLGKFGFDDNLV